MKTINWQGLIFIVILNHFINTSAFRINNNKVRLVGGNKEGEGRLEIYTNITAHRHEWVSVCPNFWATRNAGVACEELYGERKYATSIPASHHFGPTPRIGVFNVSCAGYENSIVECRHMSSFNASCFNPAGVGLCCHSGCDGQNHFFYPTPRRWAICEDKNIGLAVEKPIPPAERPDIKYILKLSLSGRPCPNVTTDVSNNTHLSIRVPYTACNTTSSGNMKNQTFRIDLEVKERFTSRYFTFISPVTCRIELVPPTIPTAAPTTTVPHTTTQQTQRSTSRSSVRPTTGVYTSSTGPTTQTLTTTQTTEETEETTIALTSKRVTTPKTSVLTTVSTGTSGQTSSSTRKPPTSTTTFTTHNNSLTSEIASSSKTTTATSTRTSSQYQTSSTTRNPTTSSSTIIASTPKTTTTTSTRTSSQYQTSSTTRIPVTSSSTKTTSSPTSTTAKPNCPDSSESYSYSQENC
jgi:hypothetical protein